MITVPTRVTSVVVVLCLSGCASPPPPSKAVAVYHTVFFPDEYDPSERVVGTDLCLHFRLKIEFDASEGKTRYTAKDRSVETTAPPTDPRPRLTLRLVGPKGTIERSFLFASGFVRPVTLSPSDAESLGLVDSPGVRDVELARYSNDSQDHDARRFHEVPVEVEFLGLGSKETVPVVWPASSGR